MSGILTWFTGFLCCKRLPKAVVKVSATAEGFIWRLNWRNICFQTHMIFDKISFLQYIGVRDLLLTPVQRLPQFLVIGCLQCAISMPVRAIRKGSISTCCPDSKYDRMPIIITIAIFYSLEPVIRSCALKGNGLPMSLNARRWVSLAVISEAAFNSS